MKLFSGAEVGAVFIVRFVVTQSRVFVERGNPRMIHRLAIE
jgi:hypothetical protein